MPNKPSSTKRFRTDTGISFNFLSKKVCVAGYTGGARRGLLETEKPRKKSPKTEIKLLTHKALGVFRISLSVINFFTYKLILLSEVLSGYSLVSAEHILV